MINGWEELAQAIIMQAVIDYRQALRVLERRPDNKAARAALVSIERFFRSAWFNCLTDVEPEAFIRCLRATYKQSLRRHQL